MSLWLKWKPAFNETSWWGELLKCNKSRHLSFPPTCSCHTKSKFPYDSNDVVCHSPPWFTVWIQIDFRWRTPASSALEAALITPCQNHKVSLHSSGRSTDEVVLALRLKASTIFTCLMNSARTLALDGAEDPGVKLGLTSHELSPFVRALLEIIHELSNKRSGNLSHDDSSQLRDILSFFKHISNFGGGWLPLRMCQALSDPFDGRYWKQRDFELVGEIM